jgi:hypothetical protein
MFVDDFVMCVVLFLMGDVLLIFITVATYDCCRRKQPKTNVNITTNEYNKYKNV